MPSVQGGVSALVAMELRKTQSGQTCLWQDKTGVKECRFFFTLGYSMLEKEIRKPCYVCLILLENSIISSDYRTGSAVAPLSVGLATDTMRRGRACLGTTATSLSGRSATSEPDEGAPGRVRVW